MSSTPQPLPALVRCAQALDTVAEYSGRGIAWLTLLMAILTSAVVVLRYWFDLGAVAMQETVIYLHTLVFWLGAAYTFKHDGHVRVDIFYRGFSSKTQAWVNCIGCIVFLWPVCLFLLIGSWSFVIGSWRIGESSPEPGGLPFLFLLKSLIPLGALLLSVQALAEFFRNLQRLIYPEP